MKKIRRQLRKYKCDPHLAIIAFIVTFFLHFHWFCDFQNFQLKLSTKSVLCRINFFLRPTYLIHLRLVEADGNCDSAHYSKFLKKFLQIFLFHRLIFNSSFKEKYFLMKKFRVLSQVQDKYSIILLLWSRPQ